MFYDEDRAFLTRVLHAKMEKKTNAHTPVLVTTKKNKNKCQRAYEAENGKIRVMKQIFQIFKKTRVVYF